MLLCCQLFLRDFAEDAATAAGTSPKGKGVAKGLGKAAAKGAGAPAAKGAGKGGAAAAADADSGGGKWVWKAWGRAVNLAVVVLYVNLQ